MNEVMESIINGAIATIKNRTGKSHMGVPYYHIRNHVTGLFEPVTDKEKVKARIKYLESLLPVPQGTQGQDHVQGGEE